jgi:hypothetical protein
MKETIPDFQRSRGVELLTEQEVSRSWRKLFTKTDVTADTFIKAEALIDELRGESPLRHRLTSELEELRQLHKVDQPV